MDSHATTVENEVQNPALRHHFANMTQQKHAASLGMWLFLVTEIMFFGGLFCAYLIYRTTHYAALAAGSQTIDIKWGAINTAVLIVSSVTVVLAIHAIQVSKPKLCIAYLGITVLLGFVFLGIKSIEYAQKFEEHHVPGPHFHFTESFHTQGKEYPVNEREVELFFSLYFAMTGMHALHMIIGIGLMSTMAFMVWKGKFSPEYHTPLENAGLYWHLVDIIWIYLFPLLYLISRR